MKVDIAMLSYLIRETLLDALVAGPPYRVTAKPLATGGQFNALAELEQRGLITSGPDPVLTENGIAEAKWFADSTSDGADISPADRRRETA